jgi:hypothetical protein
MKIHVKNLGALRQAEFELGDLTIICGGNNTGKTYATYALFGFLSYWQEAFTVNIPDGTVNNLLVEGSTQLNIEDFVRNAKDILNEACKNYTEQLSNVFASAEKNFESTEFVVSIDINDIHPLDTFEITMGSATTQIFTITKQSGHSNITISLLVEKEKAKIPELAVKQAIGNAVKDIVFGRLFCNPFIASAERTGAAIFRKELNFARNRLLEEMGSMEKELNPFDLLNKVYSDYALPVRRNVDFTRQLENVAKKESFISKEYPDLLHDFADIIGGEYKVIRDDLYYIPKNTRLRLSMDESSSAVRSLLDIGFYLRHVANLGDLLMIDEPELTLHPENQRRVARLLARLVNLGIKVFITTHSDYIVKELNTLIMLNHDKPVLNQIREENHYKKEELISADKVKVYVAEKKPILLDGNSKKTLCQTLVPADIDPKLGVEVRSFDTAIEDMNRIQEAILFSAEDNRG